jgi:hypothetical protein
VTYLDLNQIEKIKRKEKTKFRIKEKGKKPTTLPPSAFRPSRPSPARAPSPPPPPSLCPPGPPVSAPVLPASAPAFPSLSLPAGPGCQLLRLRVTAAPVRACRGLRAHVAREARNRLALGHLSPKPSSPSPPPSFAHLQAPLSPPPRCAHAEHRRH